MYEFLLIVTIALTAANSPPARSFGMKSEDQYSPTDCERAALAEAQRLHEHLSASMPGAKIEIEHACALTDKRKI